MASFDSSHYKLFDGPSGGGGVRSYLAKVYLYPSPCAFLDKRIKISIHILMSFPDHIGFETVYQCCLSGIIDNTVLAIYQTLYFARSDFRLWLQAKHRFHSIMEFKLWDERMLACPTVVVNVGFDFVPTFGETLWDLTNQL